MLIALGFFTVLSFAFHNKGLSWDFCAYKLVGDYMLGHGYYFELFRPPVPSLLISLLGKHMYLLVSHLVLLTSVIVFSKRNNLDALFLYLLIMTPYATFLMVCEGSEIMSVALLLLALAFVDSWIGGVLIALTVLTRYSFVWMLPFFLIYSLSYYRKKPVLILHHALGFLIAMTPWLVYNWVEFDHPLASILDSYMLNVYARRDMWENISIVNLLKITLPTLFFAIPRKREHIQWVLMLAFLLCGLYFTPTKLLRYYLPIVVPLAIIGADNFHRVKKNTGLSVKIVLLATIVVTSVFYVYPKVELENRDVYLRAAESIDGCATISNGWVVLNCLGVHSYPIRHLDKYLKMLDEGYTGVVFNHIHEPSYATNTELYASRGLDSIKMDGFLLVTNHKCLKSNETILLKYLEEYNIRTHNNMSYNDVIKGALGWEK